MKIKIESNVNIVQKRLAERMGQIPFASSLAINRTAKIVKKEMVKEMKRVFDRPTPFALKSLFITPATKEKLQAIVWFKDEYSVGISGTPAIKYLGPEVYGGPRSAKAHEKRLRAAGILGSRMFAVPGNDNDEILNRYGNINGGRIKQMMSSLSLNRDIGFKSNITARSRRRNRKRARYFVLGGNRSRPLAIATRQPGKQLKIFLWFVDRFEYDEKRLDFFGKGEQVVKENIGNEMQKAVRFAIKTANRVKN